MKKEDYDKVFNEEIEKSGLTGEDITYKFVLKDSPFTARYYEDTKEITVNRGSGRKESLSSFRNSIRHEIYHIKGGKSEILAFVCSYIPFFLYIKRLKK